jgi:hypothetical protein
MCRIVQNVRILTEILWDHKCLSHVTGCQKTQVSDCTSSTVCINLHRHLGFLTSCNMRQTFMVPKYFCENSDILYNPTHFTGPLVCPIRQAPLYILFCACPKPGSGFSMSYVVVFFLVFSELR